MIQRCRRARFVDEFGDRRLVDKPRRPWDLDGYEPLQFGVAREIDRAESPLGQLPLDQVAADFLWNGWFFGNDETAGVDDLGRGFASTRAVVDHGLLPPRVELRFDLRQPVAKRR